MAVEDLIGGEGEEHEIGGAAAEDVLHLLPEEAEVFEFGEVGAD